MTDLERELSEALKELGYTDSITHVWHTAVCHEYGRNACMSDCTGARKALIAAGFLDAEGRELASN